MDGEKQQIAPGGGDAQWQYAVEDDTPNLGHRARLAGGDVTWTASEFVAHNKGASWYMILVLVTAIMGAAIYWFTRDILSVGVILFVAALFGITAVRQPRVLSYGLNDDGLAVGNKFYSYGEFKSFAVVEEGAFFSIVFLPLKRFMPSITIYYDPKDEDRIMGVLSRSLPVENRKHDVFDQLIKRIRY